MSGEGGDLTAEEREKHWQWVVGILRTYGVADHQAGQIAEALLDDGMVAATVAAARVAAARAEKDAATRRVESLIEASTLGTEEAKAARESVPREVGVAIVCAATFLGRAEAAEARLAEVEALVARADQREDASHRLVTTIALRAALSSAPTGEAPMDRAEPAVTEAELLAAKAEALREAADEWLDIPPATMTSPIARWLRDRADRLTTSEGGDDRG